MKRTMVAAVPTRCRPSVASPRPRPRLRAHRFAATGRLAVECALLLAPPPKTASPAMAIGSTTPGNSTVLFTGRMIKYVFSVLMAPPSLSRRNRQPSIEPALDQHIASRRHVDAPAHAAVRNFQAYDIHPRAETTAAAPWFRSASPLGVMLHRNFFARAPGKATTTCNSAPVRDRCRPAAPRRDERTAWSAVRRNADACAPPPRGARRLPPTSRIFVVARIHG